MKTIEILSEMNIHFDEATDSLFDYILGCKKITTLDMFPKVIHNSTKYQSVEVFYQRVLDRNMKKQEFINIEKRFIDFVMSLWLYNETYVDISSSEFNNSYYYKKNKKLLKKHSKFFTKSAGNDEFLLIENKYIAFFCYSCYSRYFSCYFLLQEFENYAFVEWMYRLNLLWITQRGFAHKTNS